MRETETAKQLRDRTTLRYMADCKCGKCQCVPHELVGKAANEIDTLTAVLERVTHLNSFRELNDILPALRELLGLPRPPRPNHDPESI